MLTYFILLRPRFSGTFCLEIGLLVICVLPSTQETFPIPYKTKRIIVGHKPTQTSGPLGSRRMVIMLDLNNKRQMQKVFL
jgi:hypothetical protein